MLLYCLVAIAVIAAPVAVAVVVTGAAGAAVGFPTAAAAVVFFSAALVGMGPPATRICGTSISRTPFVSVAVAIISGSWIVAMAVVVGASSVPP